MQRNRQKNCLSHSSTLYTKSTDFTKPIFLYLPIYNCIYIYIAQTTRETTTIRTPRGSGAQWWPRRRVGATYSRRVRSAQPPFLFRDFRRLVPFATAAAAAAATAQLPSRVYAMRVVVYYVYIYLPAARTCTFFSAGVGCRGVYICVCVCV